MAKITAGLLCIMVSACGSHFGQMPKKYHQQQREIDGAFHSLSGWRGSIPFFLDDTAPDELTEASMHAADTWNNGIGREILVFSGVAKINRVNQLYSSLDDSLTQIYFEKNWTALTKKPKTTLALTIWEYAKDSDRLVKGDVILNAESYNFVDATNSRENFSHTSSLVDAESVLLHEFGHLLGLDHVSAELDPESVMLPDTEIGPNIIMRILSDSDVAHVRRIYD